MVEKIAEAAAAESSPAQATVDDLFARLGASLRLEIEPVRRLHWSWYDTFDRRLARAGLLLREQRAGSVKTLSLLAPDGAELARETGGATRFATGLPPGPLADQVGATAGVRAMLVVVEAACERRVARVVDKQAKTVARITVDDVAHPDGHEMRVRVDPVRGYEKQATKIARLLSKDAHLARASARLVAAVIAPARVKPAANNREEEAAVVIRRMLTGQLDAIDNNIDGAAAAIDTEFLHDLRVAIRRTRATLKLAAGVMPAAMTETYLAAFEKLSALTNPTRDLDVHLHDLDRRIAAATPSVAADLAPLRTFVAAAQQRAQATMGRELRSTAVRSTLAHWRATLTLADAGQAPPGARDVRNARDARDVPAALEAPALVDAPAAEAPIGHLADLRVGKAFRRVLRRGLDITDASPPEALHDLRNRAKELRYALELFRQLYDQTLALGLIRALKVLQDNLGAFQDSEIQRLALIDFAEKLRAGGAPVATLLAIGAVVDELKAREHRARADFAEIFAAFAHPRNRARFAALTTEIDS